MAQFMAAISWAGCVAGGGKFAGGDGGLAPCGLGGMAGKGKFFSSRIGPKAIMRYPYEEISVRNGWKRFPVSAHAPLPHTTIGKRMPPNSEKSSGDRKSV